MKIKFGCDYSWLFTRWSSISRCCGYTANPATRELTKQNAPRRDILVSVSGIPINLERVGQCCIHRLETSSLHQEASLIQVHKPKYIQCQLCCPLWIQSNVRIGWDPLFYGKYTVVGFTVEYSTRPTISSDSGHFDITSTGLWSKRGYNRQEAGSGLVFPKWCADRTNWLMVYDIPFSNSVD